MGEEQQVLFDYLSKAVNSVYGEERFLLKYQGEDRKGVEQAFAFRTGIYLHEILENTEYKSLDLDSEYNKSHGDLKRTLRFAKGVRPDIIIHRRDSHELNKMAIEFKGYWENEIEGDARKLEDLTSPEDKYKYLLGVLVIIGETEASFKCFEGGREV